MNDVFMAYQCFTLTFLLTTKNCRPARYENLYHTIPTFNDLKEGGF